MNDSDEYVYEHTKVKVGRFVPWDDKLLGVEVKVREAKEGEIVRVIVYKVNK